MPPALRRAAPLAAVLLLFLVAAAPVAGHSEIVAATPADGARLERAPSEVVLTFSEELDPAASGFRVLAPDGSLSGTGTVDLDIADRNVLRGPVEAGGNGTYTIEWTSAAADGHEETGTLTFHVGAEPLANTAMPAPRSPVLVGWLLLGVAAVLVVLRRRPR